jgi:hypothetical protein
MNPNTEITNVNIRGNKFRITDTRLEYNGVTLSRSFKIGGKRDGCIDISIQYSNGLIKSAKLPSLKFFKDCSIDGNLQSGEGTRIMTYALLNHLHEKLPELKHVLFEDMSNIECATDKQKSSRSRTMNPDSLIHPIPLYYFSMAFNGKTWYEQHFNARMFDERAHQQYRTNLNVLLASKPLWTDILGIFSQNKGQTIPSDNILTPLTSVFEESPTLGDFFQKIPKDLRCQHAKEWIVLFIETYMGPFFSHDNWIIELPLMRTFSGGNKHTKRNKYYCPNKIGFMSRRKELVIDSVYDV